MKIIFLDFDGVISTANSGYNLDPEKIKLLHEIIDKTGAKLVITSSWRKHNLETTKEDLKNVSFVDYIIGVTPRFCVQDECDDYWSVPRGMEIKYWLMKHDEMNIENYVILDDEEDLLLYQSNHFVKTNEYVGLTEKSVKKAIEILNMENKENDNIISETNLKYIYDTGWGYWYNLVNKFGKEFVDRLVDEGYIVREKDKWKKTFWWKI